MEEDNGGNQHVAYRSNSDGCDGTERMVGKDKSSERMVGEKEGRSRLNDQKALMCVAHDQT